MCCSISGRSGYNLRARYVEGYAAMYAAASAGHQHVVKYLVGLGLRPTGGK